MGLPIDFDTDAVISLAQEAGKKILTIYSQGFDLYEKADKSPLTDADVLSHKTIIEGLAQITPGIPVLSEESSKEEITNRLSWETYWLIDPLDGTKEFVKRNGEFTVNISLVHKHKPVFGDVRYAIDASKIQRDLGWVPEETFETGLRKTVEWYLSNQTWWQRVLDGDYRLGRLGEGA